MLDKETRQTIKDLLAVGTPHRDIASRVGISRSSIARVVQGKEPQKTGPKPKPKPDESWMPYGPYERCRGCGRMVQKPCLFCSCESLNPIVAVVAAIERHRFKARRSIVG